MWPLHSVLRCLSIVSACTTHFERLNLHLFFLSVTKMNRYRVIIYIERLSAITAIQYLSVFVFNNCHHEAVGAISTRAVKDSI